MLQPRFLHLLATALVFLANASVEARTERSLQKQKEIKLKIDESIKSTVEVCESRFESLKTVDQMRSCLEPAIELDPQDKRILDLLERKSKVKK